MEADPTLDAAEVEVEGGVVYFVTLVATYLAVSFGHRVFLQRWYGLLMTIAAVLP